jgi:hypothetical protein
LTLALSRKIPELSPAGLPDSAIAAPAKLFFSAATLTVSLKCFVSA